MAGMLLLLTFTWLHWLIATATTVCGMMPSPLQDRKFMTVKVYSRKLVLSPVTCALLTIDYVTALIAVSALRWRCNSALRGDSSSALLPEDIERFHRTMEALRESAHRLAAAQSNARRTRTLWRLQEFGHQMPDHKAGMQIGQFRLREY